MSISQLPKLFAFILVAQAALNPVYAGNVTAGSVQSAGSTVIDARTEMGCDIRVNGTPVALSATLTAFICTLKLHGVTELGNIQFILNLPAYYITITTPSAPGYINYANSYENVMTLGLSLGAGGGSMTSPDQAVIAAVAVARTRPVAITNWNVSLPLYSMLPGYCTAADRFTGKYSSNLIASLTLL